MFEATALNARNLRVQKLARIGLSLVTMLLVLPVLLILGMLIVEGAPAISLSFLFDDPIDGMTAGGIFPALVGTIWLVTVALLVSVPVGVAADRKSVV